MEEHQLPLETICNGTARLGIGRERTFGGLRLVRIPDDLGDDWAILDAYTRDEVVRFDSTEFASAEGLRSYLDETHEHYWGDTIPSFRDLLVRLRDSGVVTVFALEEPIEEGKLLLDVHYERDVDVEEIRDVMGPVESVRLGGHLFEASIQPDIFGTSSLNAITVFHIPPREGMGSLVDAPIHIEQGIGKIEARVSA